MTDEEKEIVKEIRKEAEDMLGVKETIEKAIKVICYIVGLIIGIKCYFFNDDNGFLIDILATGALMKIIELVVFAIIAFFTGL